MGVPFDLASVSEALKMRLHLLQFIVGVKRAVPDAVFVALADHDVDGIVEDAAEEEIAQLGHEDVCFWKLADSDWQGADVVVVAMGQDDGLDVFICNGGIKREAGAAFAFGMRAGVHEQAVAVHIHKPRAGANIGVWVQINNAHYGAGAAGAGAENQGRQAGKGGLKIILNIRLRFGVLYVSPEIGTWRVFGFPAMLSIRIQGLVSLVVGRADAAMASALFICPAVFSPGIEAFSVIMGWTYSGSARIYQEK